MKKLFAVLISLTLLCSCGKADTAETETTVSVTETTTAQTEQAMEATSQVTEETALKPDGVYYPPVSEREVGYVFPENAMVCFAFSYLYYNGSMYTSSDVFSSTDKAEIEAFSEELKESELAAVYSNRAQFWSEDSSKLSYSDDNIKGTICGMTGYDKDFRVCVCYEQYIEPMNETYYGFAVFDKLNDITVNKGSDLFKDRLHLDEYAEVRIMRDDENSGTYEEKLSGDFSGFVQAVFDGKFIEADYDTREAFRKREKESCTLTFYTKTGLSLTVSLYPDGYVSMTSGGNTFIEEVSPEACQSIINEIA